MHKMVSLQNNMVTIKELFDVDHTYIIHISHTDFCTFSLCNRIISWTKMGS